MKIPKDIYQGFRKCEVRRFQKMVIYKDSKRWCHMKIQKDGVI